MIEYFYDLIIYSFEWISGEIGMSNDIEKGNSIESEKETMAPKLGQTDQSSPISVIIPIYRRDSHEEVFAGSHAYPGKGVYLLKFDNSYSLWRSKTLYYRVYYTRWEFTQTFVSILT